MQAGSDTASVIVGVWQQTSSGHNRLLDLSHLRCRQEFDAISQRSLSSVCGTVTASNFEKTGAVLTPPQPGPWRHDKGAMRSLAFIPPTDTTRQRPLTWAVLAGQCRRPTAATVWRKMCQASLWAGWFWTDRGVFWAQTVCPKPARPREVCPLPVRAGRGATSRHPRPAVHRRKGARRGLAPRPGLAPRRALVSSPPVLQPPPANPAMEACNVKF